MSNKKAKNISPGLARYTFYRFSINFERLPYFLYRWTFIYDPLVTIEQNTKEIDGVPVTGIPGISRTEYRLTVQCKYGKSSPIEAVVS